MPKNDCNARVESTINLRAVLLYFEVLSGLQVNLAIRDLLAKVLGHREGQISFYLGLSHGALTRDKKIQDLVFNSMGQCIAG